MRIRDVLRKLTRRMRRLYAEEGISGRSLALGLSLGFSPTVGIQSVIALLIIALVNRARPRCFDFVVTFIGTLVVNPITALPTYALYYWVGSHILGIQGEAKLGSIADVQDALLVGGKTAQAIAVGALPFIVGGVPLGMIVGNRIERALRRRIALRAEARKLKRARQEGQVAEAQVCAETTDKAEVRVPTSSRK